MATSRSIDTAVRCQVPPEPPASVCCIAFGTLRGPERVPADVGREHLGGGRDIAAVPRVVEAADQSERLLRGGGAHGRNASRSGDRGCKNARHAEAHHRPGPRSLGRRVQLERRRVRAAEPGLHRARPAEPAARRAHRRAVHHVVPRPAHERPGRPRRPLLRRLRDHQRRGRRRTTSRPSSTSTRSSPTRARRSSRSSAAPGRRSTSPTRPRSSTSSATRARPRATPRRSSSPTPCTTPSPRTCPRPTAG